jgi:hypothetical protein
VEPDSGAGKNRKRKDANDNTIVKGEKNHSIAFRDQARNQALCDVYLIAPNKKNHFSKKEKSCCLL